MSYDGPTKSCIDDLTPLFGESKISGRLLAKDWRVRELRISRGHRPDRTGVTVTLWQLEESSDRTPSRPDRATDIAVATRSTGEDEEGRYMSTTFIDDDRSFIRWRDTHPHGYIVNHEREPKPTYLKLHRATCATLAGAFPFRGDNWTTAYAKTCGDDLAELRRWARTVGGDLDPCGTCAPPS
jgi:hypothetical protein